ncbi:MAG TPA: hypothetical protein VFA37_10335 [Gaiellaceae bacterium]|nr:hypothetical protein [Gaiellaceae bacterium]
MKGSLVTGLAVAALAVTAVVPAASAKSHAVKSHAVKLSVLPLPNSAFGSAGRSLPLLPDSGLVSNAAAAGNSVSGTKAKLVKLGRVTGYVLDYGDVYGSGNGVAEVQTGVDRYKTAADAKKGLAFWKSDGAKMVSLLSKLGLQETAATFGAPSLGAARFAFLSTVTVPGLAPLSSSDVEVADGNYVLDVQVSGTSAGTAKSLAAKLMKAFDVRLHQAQAGKLRAKPVKLPAKPKAGAPAGGPDLATLALTTSDFTGSATSAGAGYHVDPAAVSEYKADFAPAGPFDAVSQIIEWYPTAGDATFLANVEAGLIAAGLGGGENVTPVDLSSAGDNAHGSLLQVTGGGSTIYLALVALSRGQATDFAVAASQSQIQASDVQSLAQAMASRLDAGVSG